MATPAGTLPFVVPHRWATSLVATPSAANRNALACTTMRCLNDDDRAFPANDARCPWLMALLQGAGGPSYRGAVVGGAAAGPVLPVLTLTPPREPSMTMVQFGLLAQARAACALT